MSPHRSLLVLVVPTIPTLPHFRDVSARPCRRCYRALIGIPPRACRALDRSIPSPTHRVIAASALAPPIGFGLRHFRVFWRFFEPPVSALVSALLRHHSTLPPHLRPRQSIADSPTYCHSDFPLVDTAIGRRTAAALPFSSRFRVAGDVACVGEPSPSSDAPAAFETA